MQHFASLQVGNAEGFKQLLGFAEAVKKDYGIEMSQVICCTVQHVDSDGPTWAANTPHSDIYEIAKELRKLKGGR